MSPAKPFTYLYCPVCSTATEPGGDHYRICPHCQRHWYQNPVPAVEIVLLTPDDKALVCRRAHQPGQGFLDIPGGFIDLDETIEQALWRELGEELHLTPDDITDVHYVKSDTCLYEYQNNWTQNIVAQFTGRLSPSAKPVANDDVAEVRFVSKSDLTPTDFFWPELHYQFVVDTIQKLRHH